MLRKYTHDIFRTLGGLRFTRSLKRRNKEWVEEVFFIDEATDRHVPLPQTNQHTRSSLTQTSVIGVLALFLTFIFIAIGRIGYLQIAYGDEYRERALGNSQRLIPIPAERGLFYDRNGVQLTKNIPKFSLALVPQELPRREEEREAFIHELAVITQQTDEEVEAILDEFGTYSYESVIIKDDIDYETALSIQIAAADLPGVRIERGSKRLYLHSDASSTLYAPSLSHVFGYTGKLSREELDARYELGYLPSDDIGKTGIENTYEQLLRGIYGRRRIEVDAAGREQVVLAEEAPTHGHHVVLSIDVQIQKILDEVLQDGLNKLETNKASAVVMNPQNGEILAMASHPYFDNNDFSGGIDVETYRSYITDESRPLFHRTIGGTYPSGSTIKPAVAAVALDRGIVTPNTSFLSTGGVGVGQWFFPDWQAGGHGNTDLTYALAWSVNTYFYYIGGGYNNFNGLGVDAMREGLAEYGLSEPLNIDLPSEAAGFLPSREWKQKTKKEQWYIGDTYNMSIGQGDVLVTPLQIAAMTAVIANGGTLYQPRVVKGVIEPEQGSERETQVSILRSDISTPSNLATIRLGMRECVEYGSCRRLSLLPFETAGKTGTAQWSSINEDHAWFSSFAPYTNPEIVVVILVEEGGGGAAVAAPIAYDFYAKWWDYKNGVTAESEPVETSSS